MKPILALLAIGAAVAVVVRGRWSVATRGGSTPPPMTAPPDETEDGLYVPMAAYLPQSLTLTVDTSTGDVTSTVRELWRN